jgi:hypothetical protein
LRRKNNADEFIKKLKKYKCLLTKQQIRTLSGQAIKGEIEAAEKGLNKLLRRIEIAII